jgi:hypothetical protein
MRSGALGNGEPLSLYDDKLNVSDTGSLQPLFHGKEGRTKKIMRAFVNPTKTKVFVKTYGPREKRCRTQEYPPAPRFNCKTFRF